MARSTIKFLKQQGQFNTRIAALAGCNRHTVARVLAAPSPRSRRAAGAGGAGRSSRSGRRW